MGIYTRYATAVLVLLLTSTAFSAVRVPVTTNDAYIKEVLSRQTATTGAISTPAGNVEFFGPDKVYSFSAGDSVRPTIREIKPSTVGSVSYPYGPGAAYPNDPALSPGAATKVKIKPKVVVPKKNIGTGLKSLIKVNPAQIALGAATSAAVAAVGWVMSPENTQIQKKDTSPTPYTPTGNEYYWASSSSQTKYIATTPLDSCKLSIASFNNPSTNSVQAVTSALGSSFRDCSYKIGTNGPYTDVRIRQYGSSCPAGHSLSSDSSYCYIPKLVPLSDTDLDSLDPFVSTQTAAFLHDLLKEVCNASLSPARCYSDMEDRSKRSLTGPATVQGPWFNKTSTFPNPDGSTSTKTETTSTKFDISYGPTYFDVDTERKTTTDIDGVPQGETIETDQTPVEDVSDTPDEETPPEESYTFNDSDLPAVEPFYTQKYPDGFQGVWDSANTDFEQSAFVSFLNSFVPSFSGSCPAFSMSFAIGGVANFGTHGFGNLCYALDFVKVCIMLGALFLCRAIVFGG